MSIGKFAFVASLGAAVALSLSDRSPAATADFETRERARIQAHFDSVVSELRLADVRALESSRRERRAELIAVLEAYRDRGVFPRNYDRPDQPTPTFIDRKTGVRCAVAHLVDYTGRSDIPRRVAATSNHVYVMELGSDTAFTGWLGLNGLTLAEAARIQVPYMGEPELPPPPSNPSKAPIGLLTAGSASFAVANLMLNSGGKHRLLSVGGVAVGAITAAVGSRVIGGDKTRSNLSNVAIVAGAASAFTAGFKLVHRSTGKTSTARLDVAPSVELPEAAPARVGLQGRLRF